MVFRGFPSTCVASYRVLRSIEKFELFSKQRASVRLTAVFLADVVQNCVVPGDRISTSKLVLSNLVNELADVFQDRKRPLA